MKLILSAALVCHLQQPIFNTNQATRITGYFISGLGFAYLEANKQKTL